MLVEARRGVNSYSPPAWRTNSYVAKISIDELSLFRPGLKRLRQAPLAFENLATGLGGGVRGRGER